MKYRYPIALLVAMLLLAACYGPRKASKQVARAIDNYPAQTAQQFVARWPPVITGQDTVFRTDTLVDIISVQCPDSIQYNTDSIPVKVPVYIKVPLPRIRETTTITIRERDSVTVFICESKAQEATARADKWQRKAENRNTVIMWLVIALALSVIGNIIMIRR